MIMKSLIYRLFDNLFSEPLNSRFCYTGLAVIAIYLLAMIILALL